jgi:hypothetical protein
MATDPLSPTAPQLALQAAPHLRSIGLIAAHIIAARKVLRMFALFVFALASAKTNNSKKKKYRSTEG